jgi:hypothetical protein
VLLYEDDVGVEFEYLIEVVFEDVVLVFYHFIETHLVAFDEDVGLDGGGYGQDARVF